MLNSCLLLSSSSSQDSIQRVLLSLKVEIGRIEGNLSEHQTLSLSPAESAENERVARNLSRLARMANNFHRRASTISTRDRATVWGGSVLGDLPTQEQHGIMHDWISPAVLEEDEYSVLEEPHPVTRKPPAESSSTSDSGSDVEKDMMCRFKELGILEYNNNNWVKAEIYLRKAVTRETKRESLVISDTKAMFICCCMLTEKWADAESFLLPLAMSKKLYDPLVYYCLYGLSVFKAADNDWKTSLNCCQQAVWGIRKTKGQTEMPYQLSLRFLSHVNGALGNEEEQAVLLSFLHLEYSVYMELDPKMALQYILTISTVGRNEASKSESMVHMSFRTPIRKSPPVHSRLEYDHNQIEESSESSITIHRPDETKQASATAPSVILSSSLVAPSVAHGLFAQVRTQQLILTYN